jgi:3-oxo-5alpha-steroid 4-dehydrogenase
MGKLDRRAFLKGSALLSGATALAALTACAPQADSSTSTGGFTELPASWDYEADVVVIGAGAAGCSAAWTALDKGLSVTILESEDKPGGSAIANAGEITFGGGTAVQKKCGYNQTPEQFKSFLYANGMESVPDEFAEIYINRGPEMIDWLIELGVIFGDKSAEYPVLFSIDWENLSTNYEEIATYGLMTQGNDFHPRFIDAWKGGAAPICHLSKTNHLSEEESELYPPKRFGIDGSGYMLPIIRSLRDKGVEFLLNTKGVKAYKDDSGRVVGVQAEQNELDANVSIKANHAVVISGGNWITDDELVRQYTGWWSQLDLIPLSIADGGAALRIGLEAGGVVVNGDNMYSEINRSGFGPFGYITMPEIFPAGKGILVNENGTRFTCEDIYIIGITGAIAQKMRNAKTAIREETVWHILDEESYIKHMQGIEINGLTEYVLADQIFKADTVEELAEMLDAPYLPDQLSQYNKHAAEGLDPQFDRKKAGIKVMEAPFYATPISYGFLNYSQGGLDVNINCQVLDTESKPIPGLYAAGRSARSFCESYNLASTGMSCANGMLTGRIAAEHISSSQ